MAADTGGGPRGCLMGAEDMVCVDEMEMEMVRMREKGKTKAG